MKCEIFYAENTDVYPGIITRNNAVVQYEKFVHRTYHPYVIHPYSTFRVTYERFAIVFIPVRVFIVSFLWAAFGHQTLAFQAPIFLLKLFNLADVLLNFFTGYIDSSSEVAVLEPRRIVKRYLMTYFLLDAVPSIPFELIYLFSWGKNPSDTLRVLFNVLCHFLYLRYFAFLRYFNNLSKIMLWNVFLVGLISVSVGIIFVLLVVNNVYHLSSVHNLLDYNSTHTLRFLTSVRISTELVLTDLYQYLDELVFLIFDCLFFENRVPESYVYIRSFLLISSFISNILFVAYFIKYMMLKMTPEEKFLDLKSRVLTFVRMRHLPRTLECKTLLYVLLMLENKACGDDEVFDYIPDTFKADIFFQLCLPLLRHFYAFEDLPTYVLRRLAECMRYQLYLPNEVVHRRDDPKIWMYFVQGGTVALYSSNHVELYHFESGSSFNGRPLILGESVFGSYAISLEVSEVYRLGREDFLEIMKSYPNLYRTMKQKVLQEKTIEPFACV